MWRTTLRDAHTTHINITCIGGHQLLTLEIQWEPGRSPYLPCAGIKRRQGVLVGRRVVGFKAVTEGRRMDELGKWKRMRGHGRKSKRFLKSN